MSIVQRDEIDAECSKEHIQWKKKIIRKTNNKIIASDLRSGVREGRFSSERPLIRSMLYVLLLQPEKGPLNPILVLQRSLEVSHFIVDLLGGCRKT